ncbi:Endonuclease YncB, thermonuclease family [Rhizobiales bacterium GAS191]|nr:Endonuclease YncB, thermonuclease family [Rhizobiales bacterium GAS113]SEC37170.1 Endonuclease YncB, thermonuclease family [Rhizobiales bacterium GAS191]
MARTHVSLTLAAAKTAAGIFAARILASLFFAAILATGFGLASPAQAAGCDAADATPVEIDHVTEDLDIVLKDERSVRLAGVKALAKGEAEQGRAQDGELASFVTQAVAAKPVSLRLSSPVADRWGRVAGDVFVDGRHLQSLVTQAGLAVARPDDLRGPCWEAVKAAETQARRANAGVWARQDVILPASDGVKLSGRDGLFILASGQVRHVSRGKGSPGKGRSYVDFGARGVNALFLTIDAKALTRMEKLGFKLEQLNDRKILVRGVVLSGKSPHMVIDDVDAIEFWD